MIKKILLADLERDRSVETNSTLENSWSHFPIGLMYLSSAIRNHFPKIEIKIFHTITHTDSKKDFQDIIDAFQPDLIGIRSFSRFQEVFVDFAKLIRSRTKKTLIAGGPFASTSFSHILKHDVVDLVVIGEGEVTIIDVIKSINQGNAIPENIPGTAVKINGEIITNVKRDFIENPDEIAFPAYDLINIDDYSGFQNHAFQETHKSAYIFCSRGCPYNCVYCHQFFGKKMRRRSAKNITAEMKEINTRYGLNSFVVLDDCFNVPLSKGKEVLKLIAKELPDVRINFPNGLRADKIDDEFIDLLEKCNCVEIALAVETASPKLQKHIGKRLNLEKAKLNIDKISRKFITTVFFMVGFPTETYDEALMTIDFAAGLDHIAQPVLSVLRVYNHTPLYDLLKCKDNQSFDAHRQDKMDMHTQLSSKLFFYGDYFDREAVPLTGDDIADLKLRWTCDVIYNLERLNNCNKILGNHLNDNQILHFYQCFLDRKNLSKEELDKNILKCTVGSSR